MDNNDAIAAKTAFYSAFSKAQGEVSIVKADSKNPHFGSNYASLSAVMDALKPFINAGFAIIQGGLDIVGKPYLRTKVVYSKSGWEEVFDYPLIVNDANPQHLASASTYARRYALVAFFGLCVEDDDGNAAASQPKSEAPKRTYEPVSDPNELLEVVAEIVNVGTKDFGTKDEPKISYSLKIGSNYYSTFDEKTGEQLSIVDGDGKKYRIFYVINGKYRNIKKIVEATAAAV